MTDSSNTADLTDLLNQGADGHNLSGREAADMLWEDHNQELRRLAGHVLKGEAQNATLQATALVHEAYLRMVDRERVTTEGTTFFKFCFATECRRIVVDHAKRRNRHKRGGGVVHHSISEVDRRLGVDNVDVLDLHEAIEQLTQIEPRKGKIVDLRIFGGMTVHECASSLGISSSAVDNDWSFARAWLRQQLAERGAS